MNSMATRALVVTLLLGSALIASAQASKKLEAPVKKIKTTPNRTERRLYYGKNSSQATMTFTNQLQIAKSKLRGSNFWTRGNQKIVNKKIEMQLKHMFGPMGEADYLAVPKEDHSLKIVKESLQNQESFYTISYKYKGTVLAQNATGPTMELVLPVNPDLIYKQSTVQDPKNQQLKYPCTDHHYFTEGDFWYFWNPEKSGCPLVKDQHYKIILADLDWEENTKKSYPEYNNLIQKDGSIPIYMFYGRIDEENHDHSINSSDGGAKMYRKVKRNLLNKMGFTQQSQDVKKNFTIETFSKQAKHAKLDVTLYYGPTGAGESYVKRFHKLYKQALESGSVVIYDGHSGLGGNLHLEWLQYFNDYKIKFNKNQYQIFYFNSCSSYPYYNEMYFEPKMSTEDPKGTKMLDIVTNGLATAVSIYDGSDLLLVKMVNWWAEGRRPSTWQTYIFNSDSGNLMGVNGDSDNPAERPLPLKQKIERQ